MENEQAFQSFSKAVESVNVVIATYLDEKLGDVTVYPEQGTVGFGSGLHGWGFTVLKFARMYASKFGVSEGKMMKRLWGDNFFDAKRKKWSKKQYAKDGRKLQRGFCSLILHPMKSLFSAIMENNTDVYQKMLT